MEYCLENLRKKFVIFFRTNFSTDMFVLQKKKLSFSNKILILSRAGYTRDTPCKISGRSVRNFQRYRCSKSKRHLTIFFFMEYCLENLRKKFVFFFRTNFSTDMFVLQKKKLSFSNKILILSRAGYTRDTPCKISGRSVRNFQRYRCSKSKRHLTVSHIFKTVRGQPNFT